MHSNTTKENNNTTTNENTNMFQEIINIFKPTERGDVADIILSFTVTNIIYEIKQSNLLINSSSEARLFSTISSILFILAIERSNFSTEFNQRKSSALIAFCIMIALGSVVHPYTIIPLGYALLDCISNGVMMSAMTKYRQKSNFPILSVIAQFGILISAIINSILNYIPFDKSYILTSILFICLFFSKESNIAQGLRNNIVSFCNSILETLIFIFSLFKNILAGLFLMTKDLFFSLGNLFKHRGNSMDKSKKEDRRYSMSTMVAISFSIFIMHGIVTCGGSELWNFYKLNNISRSENYQIIRDLMKYIGIVASSVFMYNINKTNIIQKKIDYNSKTIYNTCIRPVILSNLIMVGLVCVNSYFIASPTLLAIASYTISSVLTTVLSNYIKGPLRDQGNKQMETISSRIPAILISFMINCKFITDIFPSNQVTTDRDLNMNQNSNIAGHSCFSMQIDSFLLTMQVALSALLYISYKAMKKDECRAIELR